jgi:hypothetical protein
VRPIIGKEHGGGYHEDIEVFWERILFGQSILSLLSLHILPQAQRKGKNQKPDGFLKNLSGLITKKQMFT